MHPGPAALVGVPWAGEEGVAIHAPKVRRVRGEGRRLCPRRVAAPGKEEGSLTDGSDLSSTETARRGIRPGARPSRGEA